jgi:leucyl aminopeptidase (aminopeptidase T)
MDQKLLQNARIVLDASCRAKPGETVLIVADEKLLPYAPALASVAVELGLVSAIVDVTHFLAGPSYGEGRVLEPLKAAMEAADIVIGNALDIQVPNRPDFSRFTGDPDVHDSCLTAERRWVYLQCNGVEKWDITTEAVVQLRGRTHWLLELLKSSKTGRITSRLGTDFTFGLGPDASCAPILGIVPLYGEVAIVPSLESTSGVLVVDGPTQLDVRPADETDREPLQITVEAGRVVDMSGDPVQIERLKEFIASGDPAADAIDEVGILTTVFEDNDKYYWSDGTHHHDRVHVALGNNVRRGTVIHGPRHMDAEICKPTIRIDGRAIVEDGVFLDQVWDHATDHVA